LPTINNSHAYTSSTKIYAPTGAGTSGYLLKANGGTSAPTWINPTGLRVGEAANADYADALSNTVTINGTDFNGTENITTEQWGTARNINITDDHDHYSEVVSVNGSDDVTLKLPTTIEASFVGDLDGNITGNAATATEATKATQDGLGNTITSTYLKLSGGTMTGNIKMSETTGGYFLQDSAGYDYPGIYDNGSNLWIGSLQNTSTHHTGLTIISSGYNATDKVGNPTIYIAIPNEDNDGASSKAVLHSGNYNTYALPYQVEL
jgi:hypothetical protein